MSKLQNDFTTKQQSEKLLALGMPRLSANFYYDDENEVQIVKDSEFELQNKGYFPCWSAGRLIEVFEICTRSKFNRVRQTDDLIFLSPLEDVLLQIEHNACGFFDNTKWEINLLNK